VRRPAHGSGEGTDLELALGCLFEDLRRLLGRARVELGQEMDDDLLVVVLVEARVAEGAESEELDRLPSGFVRLRIDAADRGRSGSGSRDSATSSGSTAATPIGPG
jgi:hypothetical protein